MNGLNAQEPYRMTCMEVWGGNEPTDRGVVMPGLNVWVLSRPLGGAGGDVHYVSTCATGRITRLLLADVAGHGREVADVADSLRTLMRANVNYMEQGRFLQALNEEFTELAEAGRFATAVVATYWSPTRYAVLSNAGHPRPMLFRAKERSWCIVESGPGHEAMSNIPLGIAPPATYDLVDLSLRQDDLLLFYTDAVVEALNPATGSRLGEVGMRELLADVDVADPATILPKLAAKLADFRGGHPPDDDLTLMLLTPNGIRPARTIGDWITIAGRAWNLLLESLRRRNAPFPWPEMNIVSIVGAFFQRLNVRYGRATTAQDDEADARRHD